VDANAQGASLLRIVLGHYCSPELVGLKSCPLLLHQGLCPHVARGLPLRSHLRVLSGQATFRWYIPSMVESTSKCRAAATCTNLRSDSEGGTFHSSTCRSICRSTSRNTCHSMVFSGWLSWVLLLSLWLVPELWSSALQSWL